MGGPEKSEAIRELSRDHALWPVVHQLMLGTVDAAASRRLNLSPRTYCRRVSAVLEHLGVDTRFQAGVEIGRYLGTSAAGAPQASSLRNRTISSFTSSGRSMNPKWPHPAIST